MPFVSVGHDPYVSREFLQNLPGSQCPDHCLLTVLRVLIPCGEVQLVALTEIEGLRISNGELNPLRPDELKYIAIFPPGQHQGTCVQKQIVAVFHRRQRQPKLMTWFWPWKSPCEFMLAYFGILPYDCEQIYRLYKLGETSFGDCLYKWQHIFKEGLIKSTWMDWWANFHAPRGKKSQEYFVYFKIF